MTHPPSAFDDARKVEERGKKRLEKWLDRIAFEGKWVWNAKGALAELIQKRFDVDVMLGTGQFQSVGLELKFLDRSPDAPFERWSNYREMTPGVPDYQNCTPGWGMTCQADLIAIYNLSLDVGVIGFLRAWKVMLNEKLENGNRRWHQYDRRAQNKRSQANCTIIYWTPYYDLVNHAGFVQFSVAQLELFDQGNPINRISNGACELEVSP